MSDTRRLSLAAVLVLVAAAVVAGCGSTPPTHYYSLALPAEIESTAIPGPPGDEGPLRVGVTAFRVDAPYDGGRLVYRVGESSQEIHFYAYHRWAHPLADDLSLVVAEVLSKQLDFVSIEPADVGRDYDLVLGGRLLYLEEVTQSATVLTRVGLVLDLSTRQGDVLWSQKVSGVSNGAPGDVQALVRQMRATLESALLSGDAGLHAAIAAHESSD